MSLTEAGENRALNGLLTPAVYVGLHTGVPSAGGNEVAGGAYARQALGAYTIAGTKPAVASNNALIQFPTATADWGLVTHVGIWSAIAGGTLLDEQALVTEKDVGIDDSFRFLATKLKIRASVP
jgi:hypothetical protein